MKKLISMIGLAGIVCLSPGCKKSEVQPESSSVTKAQIKQEDSATLYVLLDSKPCTDPQKQFTSATVDIRGIRVFDSINGWQPLTPVPGAWDVISLQTAPVPIADITERSTVHTGTITKIALTFGTNNTLVVNDQAANCYKIDTREVILDMKGEITAGSLNQIVVSIDVCGNISLQTHYDEPPCYILKPVMAFENFTQVETSKP